MPNLFDGKKNYEITSVAYAWGQCAEYSRGHIIHNWIQAWDIKLKGVGDIIDNEQKLKRVRVSYALSDFPMEGLDEAERRSHYKLLKEGGLNCIRADACAEVVGKLDEFLKGKSPDDVTMNYDAGFWAAKYVSGHHRELLDVWCGIDDKEKQRADTLRSAFEKKMREYDERAIQNLGVSIQDGKIIGAQIQRRNGECFPITTGMHRRSYASSLFQCFGRGR